MREALLGTESQPSGPTSSADSFSVGGLRAPGPVGPSTSGVTVLPLEMWVILVGLSNSVAVKNVISVAEVSRNSETLPERDI